MLNQTTRLSRTEFSTQREALTAGIRFDRRSFNDPRPLTISLSAHPGARIQLGRTSVTALSTAQLAVPHPDRPSKGRHQIKLSCTGFTSHPSLETLEFYFKRLWKKSDLIEEDSLCLKPGEKVWDVVTRVMIHDDDGGLIDCLFLAVYVALSALGFPAFDSTTGALFPPSQRRVHRIAFVMKPVAVTIGFFEDKLIADPSLTEMQIVERYATFVFNEWDQQLLIDAQRPGLIDPARELALEVARRWRARVTDALGEIQDGLLAVGEPADFIGYEPAKFVVPRLRHRPDFGAFEVWQGDVRDDLVVDFFKDVQAVRDATIDDIDVSDSSDWLLGSLTL
jgi:exosome complex component RRP45